MPGITHLVEFQEPALRALVNQTEEQAESTFADRFLPTVPTFNRQFAYDIVKTNEYIAAYIGFGAEPPYIDRDAVANRMGEIAYFGLGDIVTYEELQAIHEARNNAEKRSVVDAITVKNIKILEGLRRLIYVSKMEALFKGEHVFVKADGEKNIVRFDFGIPAENRVALSAGNDFDNLDFDIVGWVMAQVQNYRNANSGKAPDVWTGTAEILNKILSNRRMILEAGRPEGSLRINVEQMNAVFSAFRLPTFQVVDEREVRYKQNGTNKIVSREVVPANRMTFLSDGIGEYLLGPTLENNFQPGLYLEAEDLKKPLRSVLTGIGAGFPTPTQPSLIYHMDVFTPA